MFRELIFKCLLLATLLVSPYRSYCQEEKKVVPDGTDGSVLTVPATDSLGRATNLEENERQAGFSTFKIGFGYIGDYITFSESQTFKQQMDSANLELTPMYKTRDGRILGSGKFNTKRTLAWKFAFMYEGDKEEWLVRETGFTIGVPELAGHFFLGRTKEGYSMVKVMNGHSPWGCERQMALDVIPILADGIKYYGSLPKSTLFWNLGYYNDFISEGQGFSTFESQYDARVGFLPIYNKEKDRVLHVAVNYRYGKPNNEKITLKSRPEANTIPQIINTGSFGADHATSIGGEIFYSTGRMLIGTEFMAHNFYSNISDHQFVGGNFVLSYLFSDAKRPYNTTSSVFGFVQVKNPVFKGGWGAWEAVLMYSSLDLDDGDIKGGKFWRITPMVNWYMTKVIRMEFVYGYGILDRYNLSGAVQFYQARIQFTVL